MTKSPLLQADPEWSLAELFNRDALGLKDLRRDRPESFKALVAELRAQALRNAAAEAAGERISRAEKIDKKLPQKTSQNIEDLI